MIDLVREALDFLIVDLYGDQYILPLSLLAWAWMDTNIPEERRAGRAKPHLWGYVKEAYRKMDKERKFRTEPLHINDHTYRDRMEKLLKRGVVMAIPIDGQKFDYEMTEYGEAVCKEHVDALHKQIRLAKWRTRALSKTDS